MTQCGALSLSKGNSVKQKETKRKSLPDCLPTCLPDWFFQAGLSQAGVKSVSLVLSGTLSLLLGGVTAVTLIYVSEAVVGVGQWDPRYLVPMGGMVLGSLLIPVPFLGGLLGMMSGSFALVFLAERHRLRATGQAAHIAGGAVVAGLSVLFLKVMATAGLVLWLAVGLLA